MGPPQASRDERIRTSDPSSRTRHSPTSPPWAKVLETAAIRRNFRREMRALTPTVVPYAPTTDTEGVFRGEEERQRRREPPAKETGRAVRGPLLDRDHSPGRKRRSV